ncbi:MAG: phosphotransferase [Chloroflexota bacterium]|nr:phosphotransferase [Chloroflexota bacterium]
MDTVALIQFINDQHHTTFALVGPCVGGLQGGAHDLVDLTTGQHVVLKRSFADYTPPVIEQLRTVGYPTPAWLVVGEAPDGTRYVVQAFAAGIPMETLTAEYLDSIFAINELQAGINPHAHVDHWSWYARSVVFANESGWAARIRAYSPNTAMVLAAMEAAVQPYAHIVLPFADVVHGDFNPDNLLVANGHITAVIDCTYAGYGTRVIDLATLLHYAYAFDYDVNVRQRLYTKSVQIAGRGVLAICLVYRTMAMLDWAIHRDTSDAVQLYVHAAWDMLNELQL